MKYTISYDHKDPDQRFLNIEAKLEVADVSLAIIKLPSWRPGRYELGNFAKNVKDFKVTDQSGKLVDFTKTSKDEWAVDSSDAESLIISYQYYAADLNAGSTFVDEKQLYVNPVNCLVYVDEEINLPCQLRLDLPKDYEVAISLKRIGENTFEAESFHDLADSPFIASNTLQHREYESHGITFHIWFQGEVKPEWGRLIKDFAKFTDFQIKKFGSFPADEYHFFIQIDTKGAYHGVEHLKSTVIYLGPSYMVFNKLYPELLGVCSHELYHSWNVKAIRPEEMFPYDYSRENYTSLGYVAEGVTTYMGDRVLYESGVFDDDQYHKELSEYITRHFHNDGRKHLSVADSSFDTWLDGYSQGIPGRKTSIYVEGCLIAFMCDMRIRKATDGKKSLHDAMQMLYNLSRDLGYSDSVYQEVLEATGGISFDDIFEKYVFGTIDFTSGLKEALLLDDRTLKIEESASYEHRYGMKGANTPDGFKLSNVLEESSAIFSGLAVGDVVHGVNGISLDNNLADWLKYFSEDETISLQIKRGGKLKKIILQKANAFQFYNYSLEKVVS
ncbi:MAG: M61 family metallopeptidase [Flavobacteriales bacterium]|nr:M61 family metallopeptidase [Flavobacteriales bacterium]